MLLTQFKFYQKLSVSRIMGKVLAERLANNERPEIIIPIPLHIDRLKQRGFNQALEIAKSVSAELSLPINIRLCQRAKATKPQTEVPAKERHHNVRNAFKLKGKCHYRHVAILDDVVTTGSTVNELSKLLRNQGVEKIQIWCAARATPDK
jgi:ComF family protein